MKKIIVIVIFLFFGALCFFINRELSLDADPNKPIARKECTSSVIPPAGKYYLYDFNGKKYTVSEKVFNEYTLSPYGDNAYVSPRVLKEPYAKENPATGDKKQGDTIIPEKTTQKMTRVEEKAVKQLDEYLEKQKRISYIK